MKDEMTSKVSSKKVSTLKIGGIGGRGWAAGNIGRRRHHHRQRASKISTAQRKNIYVGRSMIGWRGGIRRAWRRKQVGIEKRKNKLGRQTSKRRVRHRVRVCAAGASAYLRASQHIWHAMKYSYGKISIWHQRRRKPAAGRPWCIWNGISRTRCAQSGRRVSGRRRRRAHVAKENGMASGVGAGRNRLILRWRGERKSWLRAGSLHFSAVFSLACLSQTSAAPAAAWQDVGWHRAQTMALMASAKA